MYIVCVPLEREKRESKSSRSPIFFGLKEASVTSKSQHENTIKRCHRWRRHNDQEHRLFKESWKIFNKTTFLRPFSPKRQLMTCHNFTRKTHSHISRHSCRFMLFFSARYPLQAAFLYFVYEWEMFLKEHSISWPLSFSPPSQALCFEL